PERPKFLDEAVIKLALPLARQECLDRGAAGDELRAVPPLTIPRVGEGDARGVAAVPGILSQSDLPGCVLGCSERRQGWAVGFHCHSPAWQVWHEAPRSPPRAPPGASASARGPSR